MKRLGVRADIRRLWWYALCYFGAYAIIAILFAFTFISTGIDLSTLGAQEAQELRRVVMSGSVMFFGIGGALLAFWRVAMHHPIYNRRYLDWLRTTPWEPSQRLPCGSPLPGWTELALHLAVGCYVFWLLPAPMAAWALMGYPIGYAFCSLGPTFNHQRIPWAQLSAFVLLAIVMVSFYLLPWIVLVGGVLILAIAWHGVWSGITNLYTINLEQTKPKANLFRGLSGVEPTPIAPPISWPTGLAVAILSACFMGLINARTQSRDADLFGFVVLVLIAGCIFRLVAYAGNRAWPITLKDRFRTRRLIVPSYDIIFVAPLLAIITSAAVIAAGLWVDAPLPITTGATVFAVMLILLKCGPERRRWKLTSDHRVVLQIALNA